MSVKPPCMYCGARQHADYEDGLIECPCLLFAAVARVYPPCSQTADTKKGLTP